MPTIENRCLGAAFLRLNELTPLQGDLKSLSRINFGRLKKSLVDFGFSFPFHVWKSADDGGKNYILDGHQRDRVLRELAKDSAYKLPEKFPVVWIQAKNKQEAGKLLLAGTSQFGAMDEEGLYEFTQTFDIRPDDLASFTHFDSIDVVKFAAGYGLDDPISSDDVPPKPKVAVTQPGDLWELGRHRLLCGDSRRDAVRLTPAPVMMWTDPPYGVGYVGGTKDAMKILNDDKDDIPGLLADSWACVDKILAPGSPIYVAHPMGALSVAFGQAFLKQGWRFHETLVWVKDSMVLGHSDYHARHESIIFGYKPGQGRYGRGGANWYGDDSQTTVLEFPKPHSSEDHPTMKPEDLVRSMIKNSSKPGDVVYDPFLGSGTTLIAAEQSGRICYGVELDPAYCDVIVHRWENLTGRKAVLRRGKKK